MPNEDGQFELTLGNRQLLSVFFIVVILLGVFFTMGYIVGKNSTPVAAETAAIRKDTGKPLVVDSPAQATEPAPAPAATPVPVVTAPQKASEPVRTAPIVSDVPKAKAEPSKAESSKSESSKTAKAEADRKAEKAAAKKVERQETKEVRPARGAEGKPASGASYLQLAATNKHEADVMVDVLRQKGFRAIAAEIAEKQGTFRVLVGPIGDSGANKLKSDLQTAGFPGNEAIRRNF